MLGEYPESGMWNLRMPPYNNSRFPKLLERSMFKDYDRMGFPGWIEAG